MPSSRRICRRFASSNPRLKAGVRLNNSAHLERLKHGTTWLAFWKKRPDRPFVIEVDEVRDAADVAPDKLRFSHPACGGGVMSTHMTRSWLWFTCKRCKVTIHVEGGEFGIGAIFKTASDATERRLRGDFHEGIIKDPYWNEAEYSEIIVRKREVAV